MDDLASWFPLNSFDLYSPKTSSSFGCRSLTFDSISELLWAGTADVSNFCLCRMGMREMAEKITRSRQSLSKSALPFVSCRVVLYLLPLSAESYVSFRTSLNCPVIALGAGPFWSHIYPARRCANALKRWSPSLFLRVGTKKVRCDVLLILLSWLGPLPFLFSV